MGISVAFFDIIISKQVSYFDFSFIIMNVVSLQLLDASQTLLPADELKKRFDQEGEDLFLPFISLDFFNLFLFHFS